MLKRILALFLCLSVVSLAGCSKDNTSSPSSTSSAVDLYPADEKYNGDCESSFTADALIENRSFTSSKKNSTSLRLSNGKFTVAGVRISKKGGNTKSANLSKLFGLNSALMIRAGADVTIKDSEVLSKPKYSAALFVYKEETKLLCDSSVVSSTGDGGFAVITAGGAKTSLVNSSIIASGEDAAAVYAGDGGSITLNKTSVFSGGINSPAVTGSGIITASNSDFTCDRSYVIDILAGGSFEFDTCKISGTKKNFQDINDTDLYSVAVSGTSDALAELKIKDCEFSNIKNDLFKISGKSRLTLENIVVSSVGGSIFRFTDGADAEITLKRIAIAGGLSSSATANVKLSFTGGSTFYGTLGEAGGKTAYSLYVDDSSKMVILGDCYLASFEGNLANVEISGNLYVNGVKIK